jgi:hypothetical protein
VRCNGKALRPLSRMSVGVYGCFMQRDLTVKLFGSVLTVANKFQENVAKCRYEGMACSCA